MLHQQPVGARDLLRVTELLYDTAQLTVFVQFFPYSELEEIETKKEFLIHFFLFSS